MGIFKRGENWYIDYYVNGRRKREKVDPSKSLAQFALKKRQLEVAEGKFLDIKKEVKIRFCDLARTYLETYSKVNKRSWKRDELSIKYLNGALGQKYLHEINPLDIEKYKQKRIQGLKPATVNLELACLKHIFTKAIEWGKAKGNPAARVRLFKLNNMRTRYLEKEEIGRLIQACPEHLKPIVTVALFTGMRKGEILNMKWSDIDFARGIITLFHTKNGEKREVVMNDVVYATLMGVKKTPDSSFVFCNKKGRPYRVDADTAFRSALKKTGIKDFRFHDLRHVFASQLMMMGSNLSVVQKLLGHKTLQMTQRYAHLAPSVERDTLDKFSGWMDTVWTPAGNLGNLEKKQKAGNANGIMVLTGGPSRDRTCDQRIMSPLLYR